MLAGAGPFPAGDTIVLTDSALETAALVGIMFILSYALDIPQWAECRLSGAIPLLKKYDCRLSTRAARQYVRSMIALGKPFNCMELFLTAAQLHDHAACAELIRRKSDLSFTNGKDATDDDVASNIKGRSIFDPAGLSVDTLRTVPGPYLAALIRAHDRAGKAANRRIDWDRIATEFEKHMEVVSRRRHMFSLLLLSAALRKGFGAIGANQKPQNRKLSAS